MAADGSGSITKIVPVWTQPGVSLPTPFTLTSDLPPPAPLPLTGNEQFILYLNDVPASATTGDLLNAGVASFNGRTGAVDLTLLDITAIGGAPIYSPIFTGDPQAPTPAAGDASASIATTAFVTAAVDGTFQDFLPITGGTLAGPGNLTVNGLMTAASGYFVAAGTPGSNNGLVIQVNNLSRWTVYSDNTNELGGNAGSNFAITAYSDAGSPLYSPITIQRSSGLVTNSTGLVCSGGFSSTNISLFSGNVQFTGASTTAPTRVAGDSTTNVATTAFVTNAIAAVPAGVTSFNGRTGAITLTTGDITGAGGATAAQLGNYLPLTGGSISGTLSVVGGLTAPTMAPGNNTTNVATTAFVTSALAALPPGNAGTVTSVGLVMPSGLFGVIGSPVTTAGTITVVTNGQAAGTVLAAPAAAGGQPSFRALTATDIPSLGYLPLTGGTVTGPVLGITAPPGDNSTTYATTAFVDAAIAAGGGGGGGASVTVGVTPPANPTQGNLWFDSVGLQTYIWYTDPTSSQWVPVINEGAAEGAGGGIPDAPSDGNLYGRENGAWTVVPPVSGVYLPLAGGAITGPVTAPTPAVADNSTNVATTAYARSTFVPLAGGTMTGQLTIGGTAGLRLTKAAGANNNLLIGATSGSVRWQVILGDSVAESGSNAGSNFDINNYTDGGVLIGTAFTINRATGSAVFSNQLSCGAYLFVNPVTGNNSNIYISKASGQGGANYIHGQTNGSERWLMAIGDGSNETGGNAGSNFALYRYSDAAAQIDWVMGITRSTGDVQFPHHVSCSPAPGGNDPNGYYYVVTGWYQASNWYAGEQISVGVAGTAAFIGYNHSGSNVQWSVTASDRRKKSNLKTAGDALAVVKRLAVYDLDFNAGIKPEDKSMPEPQAEHWPFSLIADEVADLIPHAAIKNTEDDGDHWVALHPTHLCAVLWKAVQQLTDKVDTLEAQVRALNAAV